MIKKAEFDQESRVQRAARKLQARSERPKGTRSTVRKRIWAVLLQESSYVLISSPASILCRRGRSRSMNRPKRWRQKHPCRLPVYLYITTPVLPDSIFTPSSVILRISRAMLRLEVRVCRGKSDSTHYFQLINYTPSPRDRYC